MNFKNRIKHVFRFASSFFIFLIFFIFLSVVKAQSPTFYWSWYSTINSFIPSNLIRSVAIDTDGTKWMGTFEYGQVVHFDGMNWTLYNSSNSPLPIGRIDTISIDSSGVKWFGIGDFGQPGGGVAKYDGTNWTMYNTSNSGLPNDNILSSAIDQNGAKWFGTNGGGVARFDGTSWTVYNTSNSGLPNNVVRSIAVDADGSLWFGTNGGGVANFDGTNWVIYNSSNSGLPSNFVATIAIDNQSKRWFGFGANYGLASFDGTNWQSYNSSNSCIPSNALVNSIAVSSTNEKWIGGNGTAIRFDGTNCTFYQDDATAWGDVWTIAIEGNDTVWFGGYGMGLRSYGTTAPPANLAPTANAGGPYNIDLGGSVTLNATGNDSEGGRPLTYAWDLNNDGIFESPGQSVSFPVSLQHNNILSSATDSNGAKWFGTNGGGVAHFDGITTWSVYNTANSGLPYNVVRSIAVDTDGSLWFATNGGGVAKFDGTNWTVYNTSNSGLPKNSVAVVTVDTQGVKWFGFGGSFGLASFDGTTWQSYNSSNSCIPSNALVNSIAVSSTNEKWIGGNGTAIRFDGTNCTFYQDDATAWGDVWTIAIEGNDTVWFGGYGMGLRSYDGTSWHIYTTSNSSLPSNLIRSIAIDTDGTKWISMFEDNNQLAHFDGMNWTLYNSSNSPLPIGRIDTISIDSSGVKWFGIGDFGQPGGGVAKYDGTNWTRFTVQSTSVLLPGGPSSYIVHVKVSDNGGILTTDRTPQSGIDTTTITVVANSPPDAGVITAPTDPVLINTIVNTSVTFTDPNVFDTHTAVWDWGDNSTSNGLISESNGSGTATGSHTYSNTGVYEIKVTVSDNNNLSDTSTYQFVVVYDSSINAGYVAGSGTIDSPEGAYVANSSFTGVARFGFISKYQPGANMPIGTTQFRFQTADLRFESTSYQWLVVSGPQAKFKGEGHINGTGNFGFLLTATDGDVNGGGGADKFRIKIWDKDNNDTVVYDNQLGALDNEDPVTILKSGNIIIHN